MRKDMELSSLIFGDHLFIQLLPRHRLLLFILSSSDLILDVLILFAKFEFGFTNLT